jgi:endo-1,4-beta-xylanase
MRLRAIAFAASLACAMPAVAADSLRTLVQPAGLRFGAAVAVETLNTDAAYARLLAREFNLVTPENAMKFSIVQPERGTSISPRQTPWLHSPRRTTCR